uniref:Uncharacterized protein n=1 Tax=Macrostomum lignano TaxID=282301 RepID=A0A1I8FA65_9PLAT
MERRLGPSRGRVGRPGRRGRRAAGAGLEARLAELTDTAADLRERLAASLASQRRQQMEAGEGVDARAEEQLYQQQQQQQQQQSMITSPSTPSSSSHLLFLSASGGAAISSFAPRAPRPEQLAGSVSTPASPATVWASRCLASLPGFGASAARMDGLYDEDIEEDEADAPVAASAAAPAASGEAETRSEEFFEEDGVGRRWDRQGVESLNRLIENLPNRIAIKKSTTLEEQSCESCGRQERSFQQRQTEALLANESAMKRDQKDAAEKRICLESQLSKDESEVERLNSELNIGGCSREN